MTQRTVCGQPYLDFEFIADVAAIEFRADKFKLPVKKSLCVPVPVADQVQDLFIVCHGVNPCGWTETKFNHMLLRLEYRSFYCH